MSSRYRRWLLVGALFAWPLLNPVDAAAARVDVCGEVAGAAVWTAANVYVVNDCRLRVAAGATLTVQPGTVVKFAGPRATLRVEGVLVAVGTAGSPISFTDYADDSRGGDTNGDGPSSGSPGSWGALRFAAGSQGTLEHVFLGLRVGRVGCRRPEPIVPPGDPARLLRCSRRGAPVPRWWRRFVGAA